MSYTRHRFLRELIRHVVWLDFRFPPSFRLIEAMVLEREIVIGGRPHSRSRAGDQDGYVLEEILQTRRNTKTARRLLTLSLRKQ
ncbi:hypothetical protein [Acetobacter sp. DsW_063]|uniref:hypothetical protein n=1 Tax=Acetobacter sp. DsW_063 TaxID=1514894 RepID=UPI000A36CE17|nr:hypothetical protein [Acetobacter sp. DsW_063]